MQAAGGTISVLYVDDEPDFADMATTLIEREDDRLDIETATSASEGLDRFDRYGFDCVVSDYDLPGQSGIEFLRAVRERRPEFPFILYTGKGREEVTDDAISAGVTDYLQKGSGNEQYALLANRIVRSVEGYLAQREADWQETIIHNMGEGVYVLDSSYTLRYVNFRAAAANGASEENWTGRTVSHLEEIGMLSPDESERIREGIDRVLEDRSREVRLEVDPALPEPVRTLSLRLTAIKSRDGEDLALVTTRDITERKDRERELREKSNLLDQLFEQVPTHLFVKDTEGRHLRVSDHLFDPEELVGKTDTEAFPGAVSEETAADDRQVIETGEPILNKEERSTDGDAWNLTSKVPWYSQDGEIKGLIGVTRRITKRKEYERELERQNERLEEFASVVSHDLRNPLNVAEGRLELASAECDSEHLEAVADAHDRIEALIDDLLTLTRQGKSVDGTTAVALGEIAESCWRNVGTVEATLVTDTDRTIRADRERFQQLLENLFRNAVEHGRDDATVVVGDLDGEEGIYVADDGPGIPRDEREGIFESGYSTTEDGIGLGLAIVKQIVEAHGWEISAADSESGGARFEITGVDFDR